MTSKRENFAKVLDATKAVRVLEALPRKPQLVVLNHHRIGDRDATPFDPEIYSADQESLSDQLAFAKKHYDVVSPRDVGPILRGEITLKSTAVLFTFDDGYLDNLEIALPVFEAHGAEAVFFLVTGYLDDPTQIPWWDAIAWLTRRAVGREIRISGPAPIRVTPTTETMDTAIAALLASFRSPGVDQEAFFAELEAAAGAARADAASESRLFVTWEEARRLVEAGMTVGAHTHSHHILSRLTPQEQRFELAASREKLRDGLGTAPELLAYPVGSTSAFSETTKEIARECGYTAAFSFYGGANLMGAMDPFDIKRVAFAHPASGARRRAALAGMAVSGRYWL